MTIGEKILTLRKGRALSQEQLADVLGVSRQAVSKWEAEQSIPDIDKIVAIGDYFGVTTDYLLHDDAKVSATETSVSVSSEENKDDTKKLKNRRIQTALEALAVALYILCITPILILQNEIGVVLMFVIIAIATGVIIFSTVFKAKTKNMEQKKEDSPENTKNKALKKTIRTVFLIVYFIVSFITGAWYITWVIFLISSAVTNIVDTIPELKEGEDE